MLCNYTWEEFIHELNHDTIDLTTVLKPNTVKLANMLKMKDKLKFEIDKLSNDCLTHTGFQKIKEEVEFNILYTGLKKILKIDVFNIEFNDLEKYSFFKSLDSNTFNFYIKLLSKFVNKYNHIHNIIDYYYENDVDNNELYENTDEYVEYDEYDEYDEYNDYDDYDDNGMNENENSDDN
jgi:hypothetical protein